MRRRRLVRKRFLNRVFYYASVCCYSHRTEYAYINGRRRTYDCQSPIIRASRSKTGIICGISPDSTKREAVCLQKNTSGN